MGWRPCKDSEPFRLFGVGGERCGKKCPGGDQEVPALDAVQAPPSPGKTAGKSTLDRLLWVDSAFERLLSATLPSDALSGPIPIHCKRWPSRKQSFDDN